MYKSIFLDCACYSKEHLLRLDYFEDEGVTRPLIDDLELSVMLNHHLPWYKRIWCALKYIFKIETSECHYSTWMLNEKDVDRFIEYLYKLKFSKNEPSDAKEKLKSMFLVGDISDQELFSVIYNRLKFKKKFATGSQYENIPPNTYTVSFNNGQQKINYNKYGVSLANFPEIKPDKYYEEYEWEPFIPPQESV